MDRFVQAARARREAIPLIPRTTSCADSRDRTMGIVEAAYLEHRAGLVRHLTMVTRDAEVAKDLAHEALLRLVRTVEGGTPIEDIGGWLHRVAMNLAASRGRHLQMVSRRSGQLPRHEADDNPETLVLDGEIVRAVAEVLSQLSRPEQSAVLLAAHGYCGAEIATRIGRTPGATRTLLCRARGKIRERMTVAGFA